MQRARRSDRRAERKTQPASQSSTNGCACIWQLVQFGAAKFNSLLGGSQRTEFLFVGWSCVLLERSAMLSFIPATAPNPSSERTASSRLRQPAAAAADVER